MSKYTESHPSSRYSVNPSQPTHKGKISSNLLNALSAPVFNTSHEIVSSLYSSEKLRKKLKKHLKRVFIHSVFRKIISQKHLARNPNDPFLCFDVIENIFSFLSPKDIGKLSSVCKLFYMIIQCSKRLQMITKDAKNDYELESTENLFDVFPVTNRKLIQFLLAHNPAYLLHPAKEPIKCSLSVKADTFKASAINRNYLTYDQLHHAYTFSIEFRAVTPKHTGQIPMYFIKVLKEPIVYSDIFYRSKLPLGIRSRILGGNETPRIINSFHRTLNS